MSAGVNTRSPNSPHNLQQIQCHPAALAPARRHRRAPSHAPGAPSTPPHSSFHHGIPRRRSRKMLVQPLQTRLRPNQPAALLHARAHVAPATRRRRSRCDASRADPKPKKPMHHRLKMMMIYARAREGRPRMTYLHKVHPNPSLPTRTPLTPRIPRAIRRTRRATTPS